MRRPSVQSARSASGFQNQSVVAGVAAGLITREPGVSGVSGDESGGGFGPNKVCGERPPAPQMRGEP